MQIRPEGQREAERVLQHLAEHPATALRLARKLVRRFVTEQEDESAVALAERAALALRKTNGSIAGMLRVVLLDGLAGARPIWGPKVKRPVELVASGLRLLGAETDGGEPLQQALQAMGQPPFQWPTPDGPPDDSLFWTTNLLPRWNFAIALARNELKGTRLDLPALLGPLDLSGPQAELDSLGELLMGTPLGPPQRDLLLAALRAGAGQKPLSLVTAGLLASPAFQWR
jgi:hypothetical protein